ncbi:pentapeptide repeat-containing protein [Lactococcus allomyrinae]|uniref:Quinolone resistance protein n=1 Tax=Lactococcus allomyrinae TaxID=2419773 RepID=A0A387BFM5_9LACT|nr:pentapeptide repeat-containing protein [Lactococcus allomyrinae]AYF99925.1 quinolone resistance protein [Lactococcus allomyrinae]
MKTKKILEPKLPTVYRTVTSEDWEYGELYQAKFTDENLSVDYPLRFSSCQLINVTFLLTESSVSEFTDCIFEKCDLSNLNLSSIGFYRCRFINCKLLGVDFTNCHLQDVQFEQTLLNYANFSASTLKSVRFFENDCTESLFTACKFSNVYFLSNQLEGTNFWETSLAGLDFSTNKFEHLEITPQLAKNIKINLSQASFFASLFGIDIV